ncbi:uncharacterized protein GIQ15_04993 [Arthroderma uncinatum]|uniref:uncharacterized protein n=1 Tax=Arthroderma uncinatum TaxID=74035 RepID=UPI00144A73C4|nr:uncharacterized protein GIQ15_04993 [Arthroderma uncinatum]KAF3482234.1 hypothetical protein GIQ15_04993 [Arthroderma uncinatum]
MQTLYKKGLVPQLSTARRHREQTFTISTDSDGDMASHFSFGGNGLEGELEDEQDDEPGTKRRRTLPARNRRKPIRYGYSLVGGDDDGTPSPEQQNDTQTEDDRIMKLLEMMRADDFNKIHEMAKMSFAETRRAEDALREKTELESRFKETDEKLLQLMEHIKKEQESKAQMESIQNSSNVAFLGMEDGDKEKIKAAWEAVGKNLDKLSHQQWKEDNLEDAMNTLQKVIDKFTADSTMKPGVSPNIPLMEATNSNQLNGGFSGSPSIGNRSWAPPA